MPTFIAGYVPSLEAIPFLNWAAEGAVGIQPCPGYGNMVRSLLTGTLDAGVIPWELFVSDLLSRPGQMREWKVPAVLKACPLELTLNRDARRAVYPPKKRSQGRGALELTFGVEARHSFTKRQIVAWIELLNLSQLGRPQFKVLPMKLMVKALRVGEVDGFVAPSPWGLQAEVEGIGKIAPNFDEGTLAQHLVLVCRQTEAARCRGHLLDLPQELIGAAALKKGGVPFRRWSSEMAKSNASPLKRELFDLAAKRYSLGRLPDEFVPDASWLTRELEVLVSRGAVSMRPESIVEIAKTLCL